MAATDLCCAIWKGDFAEVRAIADSEADLSQSGHNGFTPLVQAAEIENIDIAQFLLEHGADINGCNREGITPLHVAVDMSNDGTIQTGGAPGDEPLEMIRFLLSKGADQNMKDLEGQCPMELGESYRSEPVLNALRHGRALRTPQR